MSHILKACLLSGPKIIGSYGWMKRYAKNPEKYPFPVRYKRLSKLVEHVCHNLNADFHVKGIENIPQETFCMMGNHLSSLDPLVLVAIMHTPTSFVSKKEVEKMPFAGLAVKDLEGLFLDRNDIKQSLKVMMHMQQDLEEKRKSWIVFPEGKRNKDQMSLCNQFHHGTFRPAMRALVPVVPVAIYGTFRVLKTRPSFKRYPLCVEFLKPILPEEYKDLNSHQLADLTRDRVQAAISFHLRPLDHQLMMAQKNKKYKFNRNI